MSLLLALNQVATGVATTAASQLASLENKDARFQPKVPQKGGRAISEKVQNRRRLIIEHLTKAGSAGLTRREIEVLIPEIQGNSSWYLKELETSGLLARSEQEGPIQRRAPRYVLVEQPAEEKGEEK